MVGAFAVTGGKILNVTPERRAQVIILQFVPDSTPSGYACLLYTSRCVYETGSAGAPSGKYSDNRIFGFQGTSEKHFLLACIGEGVGILITLQFQFSKSFFKDLRIRTFRLCTAGCETPISLA